MAFQGIDSSELRLVYLMKSDTITGCKIGETGDLEKRRKDLSRPTGVPTPYRVICAKRVLNSQKVENEAHGYFKQYRINKQREFFNISVEQGIEYFTNHIRGDWDPAPSNFKTSEVQKNVFKPEPSVIRPVTVIQPPHSENITVKQIQLLNLNKQESRMLLNICFYHECMEMRMVGDYLHFDKIKNGYPKNLTSDMKFKAILNSPTLGYLNITSDNVNEIIEDLDNNAPSSFIELDQQL
jgi:T5orf172 domain